MTAKKRQPAQPVDRLAAAAQAFEAARAKHESAKAALAEAAADLKASRQPLADEIVNAAKSGSSQREIHQRIGDIYTRENIRKICKAAGIDLSR